MTASSGGALLIEEVTGPRHRLGSMKARARQWSRAMDGLSGIGPATLGWATDDASGTVAIHRTAESLALLDQSLAQRPSRPVRADGGQYSTPPDYHEQVYTHLSTATDNGPEEIAGSSRLLLAVWMSVRDEGDFNGWYDEEHVPRLLAVPGWLRCRRFRRVRGDVPDFLALHEITSMEVFDSDLYRFARETPWRERIVRDRTAYRRLIFTLTDADDATSPAAAITTTPTDD